MVTPVEEETTLLLFLQAAVVFTLFNFREVPQCSVLENMST
jgi:hypothetical protein